MPSRFENTLARLPRLIRLPLGAVLILALLMSALVSGAEFSSEGPWWAVGALASGAFLLVAASRNHPVLWNALGCVLRALVGERAARAAFGAAAVLFMLPAAAVSAEAAIDVHAQQVANAPDGHFPLEVADTASVEIRLGRGACFGTCPTYDLLVRGDGSVTFSGGDHVDSLTPAPKRLSRAQVAALLQAFERVHFMALGDYSATSCYDVTDAPSVTTTLRYDGKEKTVDHYRGCARAPLALSRLEWRVDSIVGVDQWIGSGSARTVAQGS